MHKIKAQAGRHHNCQVFLADTLEHEFMTVVPHIAGEKSLVACAKDLLVCGCTRQEISHTLRQAPG